MSACERRLPGHFSEKNPPQECAGMFEFGLKMLRLPASDGGAVGRQRSKIAAASEAIVEVLGKFAVVAGEPEERNRAQLLVTKMVPFAGPFGDSTSVPEELEESCSHVRVPTAAVSAVAGKDRADLGAIEDDTGTITFWLPVGASSRPRGAAGGIVAISGVLCEAGTAVEAKYEHAWSKAAIVGPGSTPGKVVLCWSFDGSESEVSILNVRVGTTQKQRNVWLKGPRVLVIVGPEKQRRACALRVMAASEAALSGLWSENVTETLAEVRDGLPEEEIIYGIEAQQHEGKEEELQWLNGPQGKQAVQSAATAAHCIIEYVGRVAMFVGFPHECERAREYLRWAQVAKRQSLMTAPRAGVDLSVADADMREDVNILMAPGNKAPRLRPDKLLPIERDTETLAVFDDGGGSMVTEGERRLLICGVDASKRELAITRIQTILDATGQTFQISSASAMETQNSQADSRGAVRPAETDTGPEAKKPRLDGKSDPRTVLSTIDWPATINQWGTLQSLVWKGHPKLPRGWIRIWSKSQDSEYYMRLKDMTSTFDFAEVTD